MPMNRIAVVSDIHGNLPALEAVVTDIERRGAELVVNLGDHASGPLWPEETLAFLRTRDWVHVLGNHDRVSARASLADLGPSDRYAREHTGELGRTWLDSLSPLIRTDDGIVLFHGTPSNDNLYLLETVADRRVHPSTPAEIEGRLGGLDAPLILCGHTHLPRIVTRPNGRLIVNPGSVGLPAYDDVLPEPHVVETGSPYARYAFLRKSDRHWLVELIAVPYDHCAAAERAIKNGRPDWEIALRTGHMSPF
jgi:predicted phosphodiesterase